MAELSKHTRIKKEISMPWFVANLLFRAIHNGMISDNDIWEERIILIDADTEQDAIKECIKIGKSEEHEYPVKADKSGKDEIVKWSFIQIERICLIEGSAFVNGLEVFTRYLRNSEVKSLLTPFEE